MWKEIIISFTYFNEKEYEKVWQKLQMSENYDSYHSPRTELLYFMSSLKFCKLLNNVVSYSHAWKSIYIHYRGSLHKWHVFHEQKKLVLCESLYKEIFSGTWRSSVMWNVYSKIRAVLSETFWHQLKNCVLFTPPWSRE